MYKLKADFLPPPPFCYSDERDGVLIYTIPALPEAVTVQVEKTSKEYFRVIVRANNTYYVIRIRYKQRVNSFLNAVSIAVTNKHENLVFLIDQYKRKGAAS